MPVNFFSGFFGIKLQCKWFPARSGITPESFLIAE
jgi:hypothetical protein